MRIYLTIENIFVCGFDMMVWNRERRSRWSLAAMGSSPVRK
jgi:hypothetical protein